MAPRKMLTKPREKRFREGLSKALADGRLQLNEGQTEDDVVELVRLGIKQDKYPIEITFDHFYADITGQPVREETTEPAAPEAPQVNGNPGPPWEETPDYQPGDQVEVAGMTFTRLPDPPSPFGPHEAEDGDHFASTEAHPFTAGVPLARYVPAPETTPDVQADIASVEQWYNLYLACQRKETEIADYKKLAKDNITKLLDAAGANVATLHGRPVARYTTIHKRQFQQKVFEQKDPEYFEKFVEDKVSKRFTIV